MSHLEVSTAANGAASAESPITPLPPVQCAPWCEDGTGHTDAEHPDDQWCRTQSGPVFLTSEKPIEYNKGDWRHGYTLAYVVREARTTTDRIEVIHNDMTAMTFTALEARQFANALLSLAETVEPA